MMTQRPKNKIYNTSYRRLNREKDSGSDSGEETELFVRNKSPRKEMPTIEKTVEEGDTLQSLAIGYHCTIADLKRLNNMHNENEIFARRTIKVPDRPFTMALAGIHNSGTTSPNPTEHVPTSNLIEIDSLSSKLNESLLKKPEASGNEVNKIIFNSTIQQIECDRLKKDVENENCEETSLLQQRDRELPIQSDAAPPPFNCNGADGDISWIGLIVCIVILIFAVPLIYVFYIAEHPDQYHHHVS